MDDLVKIILANGAISALLFGAIAVMLKKWISTSIEHHFATRLENERASLELKKAIGLHLVKTKCEAYPHMLEVAYRLRNSLRDFLDFWRKESLIREAAMAGTAMQYGIESDQRFATYRQTEQMIRSKRKLASSAKEVFEFLALDLEENLFYYRAFIDESTFKMLHRLKNVAKHVLDHVRALADPSLEEKLEENERIADLEKLYGEVDDLYPRITRKIQQFVAAEVTVDQSRSE